ncbi:uncharacterized protein KRP23_13804 [Phytophthora ramorum]|uniref:uncharacterized protein n=1 Tax=Phytophthora ramorum TaxID=164328 RepID=UPI0030B6E639|nr:hypothetical protein KRP23_13804 [Phytophthora ramorum]
MNDSLPVVRLRDHIDLRLRSLQQRYPDLELDVALLSSQRLSSTSGAMRSTFYNYEALEIVTLTRGRRCVEKTTNSSSVTTCSTVFVDDYRYERDIVQTSLVDWYGIIAMLRGGAQTYVWIRLLLLVYGAYTASGQSAAEKLNSSSRFASTALIVFKIPFQVIVYSSLLPVSAYVGALILDSSFTDIFLDSYWASVGGAVNFKLVPFIRTTSVEMRGVWSLALFASVVLFAMRRSRYYDEGISGIRGLLISFTSSLTVFGPYKSIRYRDMDIVSVFQMPDGGQTMDIVQSSNPAGCYNISSYIYGGSSKTVRLCLVTVAAFALIFKALGYLTPRHLAFLGNQSTRTLTYVKTRGWKKLLPQPDIAGCIAFSKLRCVITLVSLALLATDIPRTGLGVLNLQEYYPVPLMPSTAVRFGPFNYPVLHIWRMENGTGSDSDNSSTAFAGLMGVQPISAARVWSYQYDTTSVGLRGAVELLNVTEFPSFLLYKSQPGQRALNPNSHIELDTAFTMLNAFITAAHTQLNRSENSSATLRFATKHNWVDRVHHYVVRFVSKNPAWRLHSLHVARIPQYSRSLAICTRASIAKRSSPRPRFCNHPGIWKCKNPLDGSLPDVRLWDHLDLRLQALQQRYPDVELDVALLSSQRLSSTSGAMRSTFYNYEALEIVVLTRGRRCVEQESNSLSAAKVVVCTTVFVDDYRYERDIVQTNLVDWYGIIAILRAGAQTYVWVRLVLLVYCAYTAARQVAGGNTNVRPLVLSAASIVLKIPFQVIVYSSLIPVSAYVAALFLDSSFMDIFLDSYWASVGGSVNFRLTSFVETTAVQMRNVWLLALLAIFVVFVVRKTCDHWHNGVPGIRGLLISFTSTLTIAGPYKNTKYRDTNITSVFRLADVGSTMDIVHCNPGGYMNASSYIFDDSATMLLFCIGAVMGLAMVIKALGSLTPRRSWVHRETKGVVFSLTPVVPSGARIIWPTSVLSIRFHTMSRPQVMHGPRVSNVLVPLGPRPTMFRAAQSPTANITPTLHGPLSQVWPFQHSNHALDRNLRRRPLYHRSSEFRSVLQLMNIALMSDPWNLIWLRVLGIQLYFYKIHRSRDSNEVNDAKASAYSVILPYGEDEMEECTSLSSGDYQLLDSANSRDIPMSVLLQCG